MLPLGNLKYFYFQEQKVCACACCGSAGCSTLIWFHVGFSLPQDTNLSDVSLQQKIKENTSGESIHQYFSSHHIDFVNLNVNPNDFNQLKWISESMDLLQGLYSLALSLPNAFRSFFEVFRFSDWGMEEG